MSRVRSAMTVLLATVLLVLALSAAAAGQQSATEFETSGDFQLVVSGEIDRRALIFRSPGGVLVVSDRLPTPVLLLPGSGVVQEVPLLRLVQRSGGAVGLLRGDALKSLGSFSIGDGGVSFTYAGLTVKLQTKPPPEPLVGESSLSDLLKHSPEYRAKADVYVPDRAIIAKLNEVESGYTVRVIFGSWCHVCTNFLPRGVKVHEALSNSAIRFEYYGLPTNPWEPKHPEVARLSVQSLPTAVVYQGSKEIGRYAGGEQWLQPEARIWAAIQSTR